MSPSRALGVLILYLQVFFCHSFFSPNVGCQTSSRILVSSFEGCTHCKLKREFELCMNLEQTKNEYTVVFVRHGESTWNRDNRFIGWQDTALTDKGLQEALLAGKMLNSYGFEFDEVHTSFLKRSIKTSLIILQELGLDHIPVYRDWRMNERCYGALCGRNKNECVVEHGAQQVKLWRRSYAIPPPPIDPSSPYYAGHDPRYRFLTAEQIPTAESAEIVTKRVVEYWEESVAPAVLSGKRVLVCGHENALRCLLRHLETSHGRDTDAMPEEAFSSLDLPRAQPLVYRLDSNLCPLPTYPARKSAFRGKRNPGQLKLRGKFLASPEQIQRLLETDRKRVYGVQQ